VPDAAAAVTNPAPARPHGALRTTFKWVLVLGSMLAVGPAMAELLENVRDVDGGRAVTLFINGEPVTALLCALALIASVLLIGVVASRFYSAGTAMVCCGFVLAWGAAALGDLESIVRRAGDGRSLFMLAIEGFVVTLGGAGLCMLFSRIAAREHGGKPVRGPLWQRALFVGEAEKSNVPLQPLLTGLVVGVLAAAFFVWFTALSGARTQTLAAAFIAGIAAGAAAHLTNVGRGYQLSPVLPFLSLALLALIGPIAAYFVEGSRLVAHVYDGSVLNLARPVSLDWAAGGLVGIPLGISWAGGTAEKRVG
jgi:hypothetical protein